MKKGSLRIIGFIMILCITLGYCDRVFRTKYCDGISQLTTFYELENNTVDVLFLGSSHAFVNFNHGTLWDEYGIASYTLGGSKQPMWNSYYYLQEALKTQSPELIVLEGFSLIFDFEYSDDSRIIKNNYGLKWSQNKVNSIKASTNPDRLNEFWITYGQYHNRYHSLNRGDFLGKDDILIDTGGNIFYREWKGQYLLELISPQIQPDVSNVDERADIFTKEEEYYRMILELAMDRGIPILVTVVPYVLREFDQKIFNRASDIAAEYGVSFLNCNLIYSEIGVDFNTDFSDDAHMNCEGSHKFSSFFGQYIKNNYEISDRRGQSKYASWKKTAEYTSEYRKAQKLLNISDVTELGIALLYDEYDLFITVDETCLVDNEQLSVLFGILNIEVGSDWMWIRTSDGIVWSSGPEAAEQYIRNDLHDFCLRRKDIGDGTFVNQIVIDNTVKKTADDVNIVVYDNKLKTVIDCIGINSEDCLITHTSEVNVF